VPLDSAQSTKAYYTTAARNILIYNDLTHVLQVLSDAGVPVIILKGAALVGTIYPTIAYRPMDDIDLLVRPQDLERARQTLEAMGYRLLPGPQERFKPFDTRFTGEMTFCRQEGIGIPIELHWEIIIPEWYRRATALKVEELWERARLLSIEGTTTWQLSVEDTLIHLCVHLSTHAFQHQPAYHDIAHLLRAEVPFPWDRFLERVTDYRVRTSAYFALSAARKLEDATIPDEILFRLQPSSLHRKVIEAIADPERVAAGEIPFSRPRSYLLHLALIDRWRDILGVLAWLFFPGPAWLATRYSLKRKVEPYLYCLWHPLFVASQGILGLWQIGHRLLRRSKSTQP